MTASSVAGTAALVGLALRRDRVLVAVTTLALVVLVAASARATLDLYPPGSPGVESAVAIFASPAAVALYGPISDPHSAGALATVKTMLTGSVGLAILLFVLVRRHTRGDEEPGRTELLGAGVMGRRAPLASAVLVALGALAAICVLATLSLVAVGLDARGSVALGLAWACVGLGSIGVTAVAAQLSSTTRGVGGLVLAVLGGGYLLRAIGDSEPRLSWLTWLSPFGWAGRVSAYGANRWWVGLVALAVTVALLVVADRLLHQRDIGAGVLAERAGPARGRLGSVEALVARLHRGSLLGWTVGFVVLGSVVGVLAQSVQDMVSDPEVAEMLRQLGGEAGTLTDVYFATELKVAAMIAAASGVSAMMRAHGEEVDGRAELVLSTRTSRLRWFASHLAVAAAGVLWLLLVTGLAMGLAAGAVTGDVGHGVGQLGLAGLAGAPAALVVVGLAALVVALLPRRSWLAWVIYAAVFAVGELGALLGLPDTIQAVSPFDHVPQVPGGEVSAVPLVLTLVVAAVLGAAALVALRRRDIPA